MVTRSISMKYLLIFNLMQSIKEKLNKIKTVCLASRQVGDNFIENNQFFNLALIILVAFSSFGLGRLSYLEEKQTPITIINQNLASISSSQQFESPTSNSEIIGESIVLQIGKYVASKNSKLYHAPWCSGAQRIKEENKVWFQTKKEAEASGRTPASNCKGI